MPSKEQLEIENAGLRAQVAALAPSRPEKRGCSNSCPHGLRYHGGPICMGDLNGKLGHSLRLFRASRRPGARTEVDSLMTAMTYEQHKAAVDAANPTPALTWYLHADNVSHEHDDLAVAETFAIFDGENYEFEVHYYASSPGTYAYFTRRVGAEPEYRPAFSSGVSGWEGSAVVIQTDWDTRCERIRKNIAVEAHVKDVMANQGLTYRPDVPVPPATAATATLAGIGPNSATLSHWTLAPVFALDTFEYAFAAANDTFLPMVTLGFAGQAVFWKHGDNAYEGIAPTLALSSGENVIKIIVVSQDGEHVKTYTLTVTRS